uniref:Uncharacterized protein n=1 Tax=Vitis vinifera TaxID=29760 RepID=F6HSR6_VITVI
MESPDDAGLTWMIEALRAGELLKTNNNYITNG